MRFNLGGAWVRELSASVPPVLHVFALNQARSSDAENEDAMLHGDDAVVVVDGAGLPSTMRAGCSHSVAWFARSIAAEFHQALNARLGTMSEALAVAIERVADSHSSVCDLAAGSPSATVAAWRRTGNRLEYLVLCDASLILLDKHRRSTAITDGRLEEAVRTVMDDIAREHPDNPPAAIRQAARVQVEALRNHEGGFWCVNSDPHAAAEALTGEVDLEGLAGVIACSDGATRAYDLVFSHTLERFAASCLAGELDSVAASVRQAEDVQALTLESCGFKAHDDLTIVAATLA